MARIITKELAEKIVAKLKGVKISSKNKAHDEYAVIHDGRIIAIISIRRGSNKEAGHDYVPNELQIGPAKARLLGQCPMRRNEYIQSLRERGLLEDDEPEEE